MIRVALALTSVLSLGAYAQEAESLWRVRLPICPLETTKLREWLPADAYVPTSYRRADGRTTYGQPIKRGQAEHGGRDSIKYRIELDTSTSFTLPGGARVNRAHGGTMLCWQPGVYGHHANHLGLDLGYGRPPETLVQIHGLSSSENSTTIVGRAIISSYVKSEFGVDSTGKIRVRLEARASGGEWKTLAERDNRPTPRGPYTLSVSAEVPPLHEVRFSLIGHSQGDRKTKYKKRKTRNGPVGITHNGMSVYAFELEGAQCLPDASGTVPCLGSEP